MTTRRTFLSLSSIGAAALALPAAARAASQQPGVPAPIASLSSMKASAEPITTLERQARLEKARRLMAEHGLDALLLGGGTSLVYFANVRWWVSERFFGVIVPARSAPFVVCPAFEEARAREQLATGPLGDAEVLTWQEDESPYALVNSALRARGLGTGTLGIEETTRYVFSDGIAKAAPALRLSSGTPVTAGCRMIKDAHEIALMKLAAKATLQAYEAVWRSVDEGMTHTDVSQLVSQAHQQLGFQGGASVQVGEYSALPHGSATPQVVREGAILLIDGGCTVEGYVSDVTRTFVLGRPTDEMRRLFDVVHRAQSAALAAARPGVACEAVDAAARAVVAQAGFGPGHTHFTHRLGHGMGMDGHEWPYLVRGNTLPLAPGMTFSDEPGVYLPGRFGIRLEDDMAITRNGAELFTPQSPSLEEPFGTSRRRG